MDEAFDFSAFKYELRLGFAVTDPRALAKVTQVPFRFQLDLVLLDPALRWARSWREFLRQLRDIVLHEFWIGAGQPYRSPGWTPV